MEYRGIEIELKEASTYIRPGYVVTTRNGLVYSASSKYGDSFAVDPESALDGAKNQIDKGLDQ